MSGKYLLVGASRGLPVYRRRDTVDRIYLPVARGSIAPWTAAAANVQNQRR